MIDAATVEFYYRRIEHAHGRTHNPNRMAIYTEALRKIVRSEQAMRAIGEHFIRAENFPTLAQMLSHPEAKKHEHRADFDPVHWIDDDCVVRECIGGIIFVEFKDRSAAYKCPRCERSGLQWMPRYQRDLTFRTDDEMAKRRAERLEIVRSGGLRDKTVAEMFEKAKLVGADPDDAIRRGEVEGPF